MTVKEAIAKRRSLRSLGKLEITAEMIRELGESAKLAASCYNNQPWQYVFVYDPIRLNEMQGALSKGNDWAAKAGLIIAVLGKKEDDCIIHDRVYYHFDIGMATAQMILRATELGLMVHPIAGYSPSKTREILQIPEDIEVIALLIVGREPEGIDEELSEQQKAGELERPMRKELDEFIFHNKYGGNIV
ncbi:MAG: nitroreductase family protein [Candidatus Stygibacter frigidus]|nr:nitroreductase family protein [Candidatus Stygibacter frigidus]